jgi:hypothetical protein
MGWFENGSLFTFPTRILKSNIFTDSVIYITDSTV